MLAVCGTRELMTASISWCELHCICLQIEQCKNIKDKRPSCREVHKDKVTSCSGFVRSLPLAHPLPLLCMVCFGTYEQTDVHEWLG